jgi:hydrogenase expression/formation protein HypE
VTRTEQDVLDAIEARRRRPRRKLLDEHITLSHGAGGRSSHTLVEAIFEPAFANPLLAPMADAAIVDALGGRIAVSTDSYVVHPLRFPGGDIGCLAVHGTVNDLAMMGARPLALSAAFVIEEGFPTRELTTIVESMGAAAAGAGVPIATGDTKVVERGKADGVYICTTGVGLVEAGVDLGAEHVRPGDQVIVSGTLGDHGMAIMVAQLLESAGDGVCWLRDPTRGGLATVLNELAMDAQLGVVLSETALPVRPETAGACEILGIDPLYVANEGKLVAVVSASASEAALASLRSHPLGADAVVVGEIRAEPPGMVLLDTTLGGRRVVDMLAGDPLPRIC